MNTMSSRSPRLLLVLALAFLAFDCNRLKLSEYPDAVVDVIRLEDIIEMEATCAAISPDGKKLYVGSCCSDRIAVLSTASDSVTRCIGGVGPSRDMCISPDGKELYVLACSSLVKVLPVADSSARATILLPDHAMELALDPSGRYLYVSQSSRDQDYIYRLDIASLTITDTASLSCWVSEMELTPNGRYLCLSCWGEEEWVKLVNTSTMTVECESTDIPAMGIAVSPDSKRLYCACEDYVSAHSLPYLKELGRVEVEAADLVRAMPGGDYVYTASTAWEDECVYIVRTSDMSIVRYLWYQYWEDIEFTPDGSSAYLVYGDITKLNRSVRP